MNIPAEAKAILEHNEDVAQRIACLQNPMRAFAKLPPIRIAGWERETFNGTDNG